MKTILFIEDESALQRTFGEFLTKANYDIISALDGEVGLKLANPPAGGKKPDLILLDLVLPKINGFDVLMALKEDRETKNIPVIVLTNLEGIEDVNKAIELGATTYLVKVKYSPEEVVKKIEKVLINE
ncbi:response regulator [Patescibacteria group bacterium]|nr:response regulator [Patescibacteria group bacterium]